MHNVMPLIGVEDESTDRKVDFACSRGLDFSAMSRLMTEPTLLALHGLLHSMHCCVAGCLIPGTTASNRWRVSSLSRWGKCVSPQKQFYPDYALGYTEDG